METPIIIGIAGGTASGKTTISNQLVQHFKDESMIIIKQDDYYKDQSHKTMEERVVNNYDHPDAFDTDLLVEQLTQLKNNQTILKPTYDFELQNRSQEVIEEITPVDVIVLEGIFVLAEARVRDMCDIKIYCDTPDDIRFIRRLIRDTNERGRSVDSVISQYLNTVKPMHDAFIEPSKKYANIIFPENGPNEVAIDLLITKIASIIR